VQAAGAAILTVASADGDAGFERLFDAIIGAGVALVGSQFLFSPEPVALVRRAAATALQTMARALDLTADALETDDSDLSERSLDELRALRDDLAELARLRTASRRVARHSVIWWHRRSPVVEEMENAGQLDLLGVSCLTLVRTAVAVGPEDRATLVPFVREVAASLGAVGADPGDRATRQKAADNAVRLAADVARAGPDKPTTLSATLMALRIVLVDLLVFAGVDQDDARQALDEGGGAPDVRTPPAGTRLPFPLGPRRPRP
jgi:hypothetical protein